MKKIKNTQNLIDLGFKNVAYPVIENGKLKFAKLREDGSFRVKGGKIGKVLEPISGVRYKINQGKGIYVITRNDIPYKSGKGGGNKAMDGRLQSYLSGNPSYNKNDNGKPTNASTNRNNYTMFFNSVKENISVKILYLPVPIYNITENILGDEEEGEISLVEKFEKKLYQMFELDTPNRKPLGNREKKSWISNK
tara:strand:- start:978 stop:1559 length:582 start_codon:yes stop_codon:yes gene_type:complete